MFQLTLRGLLSLLLVALPLCATAFSLKGKVIDRETGDALIGATLTQPQIGRTTLTDNEGLFRFELPSQRNYTLTVSYLGYRKQTLTVNPARTDTLLLIYMESATDELGTAVVTATRQKGTETAAVTIQQHSMVVQSGIAGQQIRRTQDKDAGEVIRRVPGISLIDQKFVMVRGLSQRYNNVWINGSSVPSSEPDTRAFSFDIIPSSQMDNLQIIRSPAPEYPAHSQCLRLDQPDLGSPGYLCRPALRAQPHGTHQQHPRL